MSIHLTFLLTFHILYQFFSIFYQTIKTADLSNAGVVWIDNQSWDEHLTNSIYKKLNQDLLPGAIVIEYAMSDFHASATLFLGDLLGT